jgi:thiamine transport system substrate-binding protein
MRRLAVLLVALGLVAAACGDSTDDGAASTGDEAVTLVLLTHDSFAISDEVLDAFTNETGFGVQILTGGDAGTMVNQAILTKDNPLADVMFGVDNAFLTRALEAELFIPHTSARLGVVPEPLRLDPEERVTPIDFGDVCVNYDRVALAEAGIPEPTGLDDLTDAAYRGALVVQNPGTSSPGLAFLLATIAKYGEDGDYTWQDYWDDLRANDVLVVDSWEVAYGESFSGAGDGDRPLVVSYASSPPAELIFSLDPALEEPTTAVFTDGCFRQVEFAGILAGTEHPEAGAALIDYMLSIRFQEDIPLNMFVFPANGEAAIPAVFLDNTTIPSNPLTVDPERIESSRDRWIEEWTDIVIR